MSTSTSVRLLIACILTGATVAHAESLRIVADGKPVTGAEACFWKAGTPSNPVTRFFSSTDIKCLSADASVPIPPGEWNVYARKGTDLISEETLLVTDAKRPKELVLNVVPAHEGDSAPKTFAYIPRTGSVIPADVIPNDTDIVTIAVEGGKPVRIGGAPPREGHVDLLVPIRFASVPKGKAAPPRVIANEKQSSAGINPTKSGSALAIVRDVDAGTIAIELRGDRWKTVVSRIASASSGTLAIADPIDAIATSRLRVHWWAPVDLTTLRVKRDDCSSKHDVDLGSALTAALLRCPDQKRKLDIGTVNQDTCTISGERTLMMNRDGTFEIDDVATGLYFLRFTVPALPPIFKSIEVTDDESSAVDVELRYLSFFGRVTRDGKPVKARLFDTVSDRETGDYFAVLRRPPGGPIFINGCDETWEYIYVADQSPADNTRFDIEIPVNEISVTVLDEPTGTPIEKARVMMSALMPDEDRAANFAGYGSVTNKQGTYVLGPVLTNRRLRVCASDQSHEGKCTDTFTMKADEKKSITLVLARSEKHEGRVITPAPLTRSGNKIVWWTPDGRMTEMVQLSDPDGKFVYKKTHAEGELVTLIVKGQPFYVFRQPRLDADAPFVITLPNARRRTFTVTLADTSAEKFAFVTLRIGDLLVPLNALGWHEQAQGIQSALEPGWTITVSDILETAPITVILVPGSVFERHPNTEMPFIPEAPTLPQQLLGNRDSLTF